MDNATKLQLESLIGTTVSFENQNITINKFKEIGGNVCVITSARTFQFYPHEVQSQFIDKISDVKEKEAFVFKPKEDEKVLIELPSENLTIKESLLEALRKVKDDPTFLAQAKSICEITNAMVNVQKTEIEMIKLQKDL